MRTIARQTRNFLPIVVIFLIALTMVAYAASNPRSTTSSTSKSPEAQTKTKDASSGDAVFVYKQASKSVVTIEAISDDTKIQGSGVVYKNGMKIPKDRSIEEVRSNPSLVIPRHSWIISSAHVVKEATRVAVLLGGQQYQGIVRYADDDLDLAVIFVKDIVLSPSRLESGSHVAVGDKVFAIGSPLGLEGSITEGILSGNRERDGAQLLQTTAPISKGNSGGGLFDGKGRLIGIISFKLREGENINFAIDVSHVDQIHEALTQAEVLRVAARGNFTLNEIALINSYAFIKWLLNEFDVNGERLYIVAKNNDEEFLKKSFSYEEGEKYFQKQVQFLKYFVLKHNGLSTSKQETGDGKMTLICSASTKSGDRHDFIFVIDLESKTVNEHKANISDAEIWWKIIGKDEVTEYSYSINRFTGLLSVFTEKFPFLMSGKCTKSSKRQF